MISIRTEKAVKGDGEKGRKILGFSLMRYDELPSLYTDHECVYKDATGEGRDIIVYQKIVSSGTRELFRKHDIVEEKSFQENMILVKKCGENLQQINDKLSKIKKKWNGKEDFKI